jgi:hypothetical protein
MIVRYPNILFQNLIKKFLVRYNLDASCAPNFEADRKRAALVYLVSQKNSKTMRKFAA